MLIPIDPIIRHALTEGARVMVNNLPREVKYKIIVLLTHPDSDATHTLCSMPVAEAAAMLREHASRLERPSDLAHADAEGTA
jgi:hypothetical protein